MYHSKLSLIDTEVGIKHIKTIFEGHLSKNINLLRVSAPLFLEGGTGINDNLNGIEPPVTFKFEDKSLEVVQSLAKWKRMALHRYGLEARSGLYTDMNAIRPCEELTPLHSLYVDQWDWEKVVAKEERHIDKLKDVVLRIYDAVKPTEKEINAIYPVLEAKLPEDIFFITTQELEDKYPSMTPKEREFEVVKEHGAVFIMCVGGKLKSGIKHDGRSPDYDDWNMNGDIVLYHKAMDCALEISSMGIRVDAETMLSQLEIEGALDRKDLEFHKGILDGTFPLSIGGGIGQSRVCMFLLEKVHVGEVQVSVWPDSVIKECADKGIFLL